eukprot:GHVU01189924.1.p1 GENE.GHVU01189924.1~~GHVU01189924.1.p1  ORF type:complete len:275 (+),score=35.61 GHVU01189924.1:57-881(+)
MTIYTGKEGEKLVKKDVPDPEVVTDPLVRLDDKKKDAEPLSLPPPHLVAIAARRRPSKCTHLCVLFTALFVLSVGVIGGIYLYKHLAHKTFRGICGVQYYEYQDQRHHHHRQHKFRGHFEERLELDTTDGKFERIEVPAFDECRRATILHDFDKNYTAIVDQDDNRCFILPLNRSLVKPPRDFWDLLLKLKTGYYLPDAHVIRIKYQVVQPPIINLAPFGYYIWHECSKYDTYRLLRSGTGPVAMVKRSVDSSHKALKSYGYSAGRGVVLMEVD